MPRIAVVTPYHREPVEVLRQCRESVRAQRVAADHIMVADGHPQAEIAAWGVRHVVLPSSHGDFGATPRAIGSVLADAEGYDFVAYLDADNWFEPDHLSSLLDLHAQSGSPVCCSFRSFRRADGSPIDTTEAEEDSLAHVDTSCFLLHRTAFIAMPVWTRMPRRLAPLGDRIFLAALRKERFTILSTRRRTVAYRTLHELHYRAAGLEPPPGFKPGNLTQDGFQWLLTKEGVEACFRELGFWPLSFL